MALMGKLSNLSDEVAKKAKIAADTSKNNQKIKDNQKLIEKLLYQMGAMFYDKYQDDINVDTDLQAYIQEVKALLASNTVLAEENTNMNSRCVCANCNFANDLDAKFCKGCGNQMATQMKETVTTNTQCGSCNEIITADDVFCGGCGTKVN